MLNKKLQNLTLNLKITQELKKRTHRMTREEAACLDQIKRLRVEHVPGGCYQHEGKIYHLS